LSEEKIIELYAKERAYQKCMFGDYKNVKSFNIASFISFIRHYLDKAEKGYIGPWITTDKVPEWLKDCKEMSEGSVPIEAYENLIKVFALAGAALYANADFDVTKWREDVIAEGLKWIKANPSILKSMKENLNND
jgi:hypothetical protein